MSLFDLSAVENVAGAAMNLTDVLGTTKGLWGGFGQDKKIDAQKEVIITMTNAQKEMAITQSNNKKEVEIVESNNKKDTEIALIEAKSRENIENMRMRRESMERRHNITISAFNLVLNLAEKNELTETMFVKILDVANAASYQTDTKDNFNQ